MNNTVTTTNYSTTKQFIEIVYMAPQMRISPAALAQPEENLIRTHSSPPLQIIWTNVLVIFSFHAAAIYGLYLWFACAKWATVLWGKIISIQNSPNRLVECWFFQ